MTGTEPLQVEIEAVRPIADGAADSAIVTELHAEHGAALYNFARHLGLDDTEAADAVQEALLQAVARTPPRDAHREALWAGPIGRATTWPWDSTAGGASSGGCCLGSHLSHSAYAGPESSDRVSVWAAVDELPPRQRHVVYLHYAADLPFDEIAVIVGISPSAARTHASRGLATLRRALADGEVTP